MNRLDDILTQKRQEVEKKKRAIGLSGFPESASRRLDRRPFGQTVRRTKGLALIAEIKRASPTAGLIRQDFEPASLARAYEKGGAHALSVLTDESFFQGKLKHLLQARRATLLPCLRKDFVIDEYQIWEAHLAKADAVLLIVAALNKKELSCFMKLSQQLEMDPLVEVHDEVELNVALESGAQLIGINNRNLQTFQVDLKVTEQLAPKIPKECVIVSESGISSASDARRVRDCGVHAILVGESLMCQPDVESAVRTLMEGC